MKTSDLDILRGLLTPDLSLTIHEGRWSLMAYSGQADREEIVAHRDWEQFILLCSEYSDFVPEDGEDSVAES